MAYNAHAQPFPDLKFSLLSVKDGLGSNDIRCLFEDSRGIIWIGTEGGGLNRYTSTGIKVYKHDADNQASIPGNTINAIIEDSEGYLWLATNNGLCQFNPYNGLSENILYKAGKQNGLSATWITSILFTKEKNIILSTDNGVQLYYPRQKKFVTFQTPPNNKTTSINRKNSFGRLAQDSSGRVWALQQFGMYQLDFDTKKLIFYDQGIDVAITSFYQDKNKDIYLGYWPGGVKKFVPETNEYIPVEKDTSLKSGGDIVGAICEWKDNASNTWMCIGTNAAFTLRNKLTGETKEYLYDKNDPFSYSVNLVSAILIDRQNRLWLGADNGLQIIDPRLQNFSNIQIYKQFNYENPVFFGVVSSFFKTQNKYYFSVWHNKGLYAADENWNVQKVNTANINKNYTTDFSYLINSYLVEGNVEWISTDSGLVKRSNGKVKLYAIPPSERINKISFPVSKIIKRADGLFWLRSSFEGIFLFDPKEERFIKLIKIGDKGLAGNRIFSMFLERNGRLWAGTDSAIVYYDEESDAFKNVPVRNRNQKPVSISSIWSIVESKDGKTIWAASNGSGLIKIDQQQLTGIQISAKDGLFNEDLYRIVIDTAGIIWASSSKGLIRYDDKNKKSSFFNYELGLPFLFNNWGFLDFDNDGNLLMSNSGIITRFNPYTFVQNTIVADVVLLDVTANGSSIKTTDTLVLPAGTNAINLQFAITNYTAQQLNRYYYKFSNADKWQEVKNGNIFFGSLPHGKYEIHLKGSNNEGIDTKEKIILLTILPFWYETLLFKILLIAAIAALAYYFAKLRIRNIRKESLLKQKISETEMKALRSQMNPHFIFNCLNSIELYTAQNNSEAATYYLSRFSRLIRLVLDNSKSDRISLEQELETLELYLEMEKMRFKEKLQYQISVDKNVEADFIEIPPMLIQPYVENAIWHGIMHKAEGGNISVKISLKEDEEQILKIIITDDGVGRAKASELKSKSATKHKSYGMKITTDRMNMLNEMYKITTKIDVEDLYDESHQPTGTKVTIQIPV